MTISDQLLQRGRANATFLMLARNSDVDDAVRAVREMEDRFNHKHRYPWVILNEQPFSDDFKRYAPIARSFFSKVVLSMFLTYSHTHIPIVACRLSPRVPCILGRFPRSIGINLRGSTRPGQRRREIRWRKRASYMVAVYRTAFPISCLVSVVTTGAPYRYRNMCRFNSGVRISPLSFTTRPDEAT